ncbi:hypothetical protein WIW49_00645 [Xanthomonas euroxanthea]
MGIAKCDAMAADQRTGRACMRGSNMLFWDLGVLLTPGDEPGFLCVLSLHAIAIAVCKFANRVHCSILQSSTQSVRRCKSGLVTASPA